MKVAKPAAAEKNSTSPGTSILSLLEKMQKQADYFQRCTERNLIVGTNEEQEALVKDLSFAAHIGKTHSTDSKSTSSITGCSLRPTTKKKIVSCLVVALALTVAPAALARAAEKDPPALSSLIKATTRIRRRRTLSTMK